MEVTKDETIEATQKRAYPTIGQGFGIFGVSILIQLAIGGALSSFMRDYPSLGMLVVYSLTLGLSILFAWAMGNRPTLKLGPLPIQLIPAVFLITPAISLLMEPIIEAIPYSKEFQEMFAGMMGDNMMLIFLTVAIAAPILEEVLFRGIILEGFLKNYAPRKAIFWSAIIFGLIHMNPYQFIAATLIGLLMGWIYWRTGSLWLCILIHFINNSMGFALSWYFDLPEDSMEGTRELINNDSQYGMLLGGALVTVGICLYMLNSLMEEGESLHQYGQNV